MSSRTTAADLIKKLQVLPPDTNIVVSGPKGGFDDVDINPNCVFHLKENEYEGSWTFGCHEEVDDIAESDFTAIPIVSKC